MRTLLIAPSQTLNRAYMMAISFMHDNFVRIHHPPPAMAAGVISKLWEMADIVKALQDREFPKVTSTGLGKRTPK